MITEPDFAYCVDCREQVLVCLYNGATLHVDPVPVAGAHLELCGVGLVRKPIAVVSPNPEPGHWRYNPHRLTCVATEAVSA